MWRSGVVVYSYNELRSYILAVEVKCGLHVRC
jgi:hypothetical protein